MQQAEEKQNGLLITRFLLEGMIFAVDAQLVQEVVKVGEVTPVHGAPPDVTGVRNLRGKIVTVIDMASHLGLGKAESTPQTRLLIMEYQGELFGFLVHIVIDALELNEEQIGVPPSNLSTVFKDRIKGVWRDGDILTSILKTEALFQWVSES